ncbi:hypothetical protein [Streptomyces sp. NPDC058855]|uniref:hypothetical protein n=1 Tax=Streptomyces sp. NPDC058855 TaxID=3346651 RepID=UPI0036975640
MELRLTDPYGPGAQGTTGVALRIVGELDAIISSAGPYAARTATADIPMPRIAEALGMTEKAARSRLHRYDSPLRH